MELSLSASGSEWRLANRDVWRLILSLYCEPIDVCRFGAVCSEFRSLSLDAAVWRVLWERYWLRGVPVLPAAARKDLPQKQRFRNSGRERYVLQRCDTWMEHTNTSPCKHDFLVTTLAFRDAVWPTQVFFIGVNESHFFEVIDGRLCNMAHAVSTYSEIVSGTDTNGMTIQPVTNGRSIFEGSGTNYFAAMGKMVTFLRKSAKSQSGTCVLVEPGCGFGQRRADISQSVRQSLFGGCAHFYGGTVDVCKAVAAFMMKSDFFLAVIEGDKCWAVAVRRGAKVAACYFGYSPRRQPQKTSLHHHLLSRKHDSSTAAADAEKATVPLEEQLAAHLKQSVDCFNLMFFGDSMTDLVIVCDSEVFDEVRFRKSLEDCQLSRLELTVVKKGLAFVACEGVAVLQMSFSWVPDLL
jgi:hypothetical protein